MNLTRMRMAAREIFDEALRAVEPAAAVKKAVSMQGGILIAGKLFALPPDRCIFSVAMGKAAVPMAAALEDVLGDRFTAGVLSAPVDHHGRVSKRWNCFVGGHPLPNESSLAAARAALALLDRANAEGALVIFLVSGGGSALMEAPIDNRISLPDLQSANETLVNSGASITEINVVRRAFSLIKAGRLAARAANCEQISLIVSDVPAGEEAYVASGPTWTGTNTAADPAEIISRYRLRNRLPTAILDAIAQTGSGSIKLPATNVHSVVLDNRHALQAAAAAANVREFPAHIAREIGDEPIATGCTRLIKRLTGLHGETPFSLLSGGEFACPVSGDGVGGRNLETALRLALEAQGHLPTLEFVALCAGTDGIDGNSPAAGAIVDHTTIARADRIELDPQDFLKRSDSYSFFAALDDLVTTGPTGTNVRDLRILLAP